MKKLLLLALSVSAAVSLTACGSSYADVEIIDAFTGEDVTIEFWHVSDDVNGVSPYQAYKDSFEALYPNVTVNLVYNSGSYSGLTTNIENAITTKKVPNVAIGYSNNFVEYNVANVVVPLDDFISDSKWGLTAEDLADYKGTGFWDDGSSYDEDGTVYSMSLAKSSEAMYVRKDLVDLTSVGINELTTWDKVFEVCKQLEALNVASIPYEMHHDTPANFALTLFGQSGAAYTSLAGELLFVDDAKNSTSKAIINEIVVDNADYIMPRAGSTYGSAQMENNNVWMNIGSTSCRSYYDKISTENAGAELVVLPVPQYTNNTTDHYAVLQGPSMAMFKADNVEEYLASWLFMKHITNTENAAAIAMDTGYMPVRVSSQNTTEFKAFLAKANDPMSEDYNKARACSAALSQSYAYQGTPAFLGSNEARTQAGNIISNILDSGYTLDQAFATAKENLLLYI